MTSATDPNLALQSLSVTAMVDVLMAPVVVRLEGTIQVLALEVGVLVMVLVAATVSVWMACASVTQDEWELSALLMFVTQFTLISPVLLHSSTVVPTLTI